MPRMCKITIYLPHELKKRLEDKANRDFKRISEYIRDIILKFEKI